MYLKNMQEYRVEFTTFSERKIKKLSTKQREQLFNVVKKLEINPFDKSLKTHKLSGKSTGYYSCSMNYSDRVIFIMVVNNVIAIIDIGSHDEVY